MTVTEIVRAGGALAIRPEQTDWTPQQAAVLRQSGISSDVTAEELSGFLHLCQRTQLDPFSRQIYLIGRKDKRAGRTVFTPQTGIDGYRVIAHRVVAESRENFGYEDTQWCDSAGRWRDVWLSNEPPAAAKVTVVRNGHRFPAIALYREYVQTGWENKPVGLWGKMPAGQLAKCAEALALRKAFPHDLAGVYTAEEMAQADNPAPVEQPAATVRQIRPDADQADRDRAITAAADLGIRAADATTIAEWREVWTEAGKARLLEVPIVDPDGDAQLPLGEYLTRRGAELKKPTPSDGGPTIVDAEVVDDRTVALDDLRAAAIEAEIADSLAQDFAGSYGVPIEQGTTKQYRDMANLLRGAA